MVTKVLNNPSLGARIKSARKQADIAQEQLASILNITRQQLWNYEAEKSIPPSDKVLLIADTCKVDPGWLLSGRGNPF